MTKGKVILIIVVSVLVLVTVYFDLLLYGIRQGKGQLHIIYNAKPVQEILSDPKTTKVTKEKLALILKKHVELKLCLYLNFTLC